MRLLFLSYYYPPIKSIGVRRNWFLSESLRPICEQLFVITTSNRNRLPQDTYDLDESKVFIVPTFDYRTLLSWSHSKRKIVHFSENTKSNPLIRYILRLLDSFPFNLLFHEGGLIYTIASFWKAVELIRREKITHVYTSFRPMSDHFTAYLLKICFPKLIWIADFRDLHVDPLYQMPICKPFQLWCCRRLIRRANLTTTISEGLAVHLRQLHSNVYVLRNGVILDQQPLENVPNPTKFTVAYTGSMFLDERNPQLLLEILRGLSDEKIIQPDNFQVVYAGKDVAIWQEWINRYDLNAYFFSHGLVKAEMARNIQHTAHINLLLTSAMPNYGGVLTGKFFEYLAARRPIIVLINGTQDIEFEQIMSHLSAGLVAYNSQPKEALRAFIVENFDYWQRTGLAKKNIDEDRLKKLNWQATAQKFMDKIQSL